MLHTTTQDNARTGSRPTAQLPRLSRPLHLLSRFASVKEVNFSPLFFCLSDSKITLGARNDRLDFLGGEEERRNLDHDPDPGIILCGRAIEIFAR